MVDQIVASSVVASRGTRRIGAHYNALSLDRCPKATIQPVTSGGLARPSLREGEVTPPRKTLAEILEALPAAPGVYIMKDARGKPIYIGKAAVLRNRVRQYFQPASGDTRDFVPLLDGIVADIETVVTSTEKEALLLENTLIKQHQPRFNVKLTDDKNFLVLRLDPDGDWPRLEVVRRIGHDDAHYFGPYHSATSCRETLRVVNRHFQLRTCTDHVLHNRRRPCLQYQIKRCPAPVRPPGRARGVRRAGPRRARSFSTARATSCWSGCARA